MFKSFNFKLNSKYKFEIIDITSKINEILNSLDVNHGIVNIFTKHSTSAIVINENERGLLKDFENILNDLIKKENNYFHDEIDNNANSHLKSLLLSSSETIPIKNSKLDLGVWQSVFFIEFDGPRVNRTINLTIIYD